MTPGGGAPPVRLLGGDGRLYREPAFSPDGALLVYAAGEDGSGRTHLELLEIATGARRKLTGDPHRSDGRPAFSPDGNEIYFEAELTGEGDTGIFALNLLRDELTRVTATGAISRRPAPLSHSLVVVERHLDGAKGATHLVLVDRHAVRERDLTAEGAEHREPAALRGKNGKFRLAYTALTAAAEGEPRRFDVCTARLKGLQLADAESLPDTVEVPAVADSGDRGGDVENATA